MMTRSRISANPWRPSKRSHALVPLLLAIAGLASCTQSLKVTGAWNEGATRPQTFKKLLIVGVSPDYRQRCNFEWVLATTLRSDTTVTAIRSCSVMKADELLSRESVERVVASLGADGVLASRLVAAATSLKEGGSRDTRGSGLYKATDMSYGYYGMPVVYADFAVSPSIFELESEFEITTQLYETRGPSLVYSLKTTGKTQDANNIVRVDISSAIAARLHEAGLIP
jgi:hypothetical protein